jgi:hypothetical protein
MEDRKQINFKPSDKEMKILEDRCADMGLTKTAVLRELIRKLGEENAEDSRAIAWLAAEAAADSTPSLKGGACVSLFGQSSRWNCSRYLFYLVLDSPQQTLRLMEASNPPQQTRQLMEASNPPQQTRQLMEASNPPQQTRQLMEASNPPQQTRQLMEASNPPQQTQHLSVLGKI